MKAANIRRPPRNPADGHVQACADLCGENFESRFDIPRPYGCAEPLTARPGGAAQEEWFFFAGFGHSLGKGLGVQERVKPGNFAPVAQVESQVVIIDGADFRFAGIEPENTDAFFEICLLGHFPECLSRLWMGRVVVVQVDKPLGLRVEKREQGRRAALGAKHPSFPRKLLVAAAVSIERRPDGNHHLHPDRLKFLNKTCGIRPSCGIEAHVAHHFPVEEIDHNDRERKTARLVFMGDAKKFVLRFVTQFALPESRCPIGKHRRMPSRFGISGHDLRWRVSGGDPIVYPRAGIRHPACVVLGEFDASRAGIVPKESIASVRKREGDGNLAIPVCEIENAPLLIQAPVPVLAETENFLRGIREKTDFQFVQITPERFEFASAREKNFRDRFLKKNPGPIALQETQSTFNVQFDTDFSIREHSRIRADFQRGILRWLGIQQRAGKLFAVGIRGGADSHPVAPPGFERERFALEFPSEDQAVFCEFAA